MREAVGAVRARRDAGDRMVVLRVECDLAGELDPGEFLNVKVPSGGEDPFLRRPFSVSWAEPEAGLLELLVQIRGRGSALIGAVPVGGELSLLGPLGSGFPLELLAGAGAVDLVAGACGAAPLLFLAQRLAGSLPAGAVRFFLGARTRDLLPEPDVLAERFPGILFATEDGSAGFRGNVLDLFMESFEPRRVVCACGPTGLLEALRRVAVERGIACHLSLEASMACGYGVCKGCVVELSSGDYATVCHDGPVFEASALAPLGRLHA